MKDLERLIARQVVFALIPLREMTCRSGQISSSVPISISLAGMK